MLSQWDSGTTLHVYAQRFIDQQWHGHGARACTEGIVIFNDTFSNYCHCLHQVSDLFQNLGISLPPAKSLRCKIVQPTLKRVFDPPAKHRPSGKAGFLLLEFFPVLGILGGGDNMMVEREGASSWKDRVGFSWVLSRFGNFGLGRRHGRREGRSDWCSSCSCWRKRRYEEK